MILKRRFGPGFLVAAAFIGPGTVTTATRAGAAFEYDLAWTVAFAVVATIILQEMAARLGLVTRSGLGEALRSTTGHPIRQASTTILVISAIAVGNAAYEMGNITGAAIGLSALSGLDVRPCALLIAVAGGAILLWGRYGVVEKVLIILVAVMSVVFVLTACMIRPDLGRLFSGLITPRVTPGSITTVVALIGTTVVPYNLFLHASSVARKWHGDSISDSASLGKMLRMVRVDAVLAIGLGGAITLAILVTAAHAFEPGATIEAADAMASQLEPLLGRWARSCFSLGILAAGFTSTITAALAAAYATAGILGWEQVKDNGRFRAVSVGILLTGATLSMLGTRPVSAIVFAQAANGLLLPVIAIFLWIMVNRRAMMQGRVNSLVGNILTGVVVATVSGLGMVKLYGVFFR